MNAPSAPLTQAAAAPTPGVTPPPQPKSLAETGLSSVLLRDLLLKTMFRMNLEYVTDISRIIALPLTLVQELVDSARTQRFIEATGTLHATSSNEMGYRLTDSGKARALDALSQSEYYGAAPVPLDKYKEQVKRQSVRNIMLTRQELLKGMGHLILPPDLIDNLGPAVTSGRSILMYGPPATANPPSRTASAMRWATRSMSPAPSNIPARSSRSMTRSSIPPPKNRSTIRTACAASATAMTRATSAVNAPR